MKRPVMFALLFLLLGIMAGMHSVGLYIAGLAAVSLALALCAISRNPRRLVLLLFTAAGFFSLQHSLSPASETLEAYVKSQGNGAAVVEGRITALPISGTGYASLRAIAIDADEELFEENITIQVKLPSGTGAELGQRVVASGRLELLDFPRNPGAFDEFTYLRARGVEYTMIVDSMETYETTLTPSMYLRVLAARMSAVFDAVLDEPYAGMVKAIVIGDKDGLDTDIKSMYKAVGVYHVLVVSGLHVSILAAFIRRIFGFLGRRRSGLAALVFLCAYCVMTGCGVAAVRASLMSAVAIIGELLWRDRDAPSGVALAGTLLLLYEPLYLWDIGFIYSFAMVAGLMLGAKPVERLLDSLAVRWRRAGKLLKSRFIKGNLPGCLAAFMVYVPLNCWFFYEFAPVSLIANLLVLPVMLLVVCLGFAAGVVGLFALPAAKLIGAALSVLLAYNNTVCELALKLPFAVVLTGRPSALGMLAWAAVAATLYGTWRTGKSKHPALYATAAVFAAICLCADALWPRGVEIVFLDVSQGDCAVVSAEGSTVVFDGGGLWGKNVGSNTGSTVLMPYLDYNGVSRADAVIVTHNDSDHATGIIELLLEGRAKTLVLSEASRDGGEIYKSLLEAAATGSVTVEYISAGAEISFGGVSMKCLNPAADFSGSDNNASLVFRLTSGTFNALFTGDLEQEGEKALMAAGAVLEAEVLKVGHHGSSGSSSAGFLKAVSPSLAIISSGANNIYGHPSEQVLERLVALDIPYLNTADSGAIFYQINSGEGVVEHMAERDRRTALSLFDY